MKQLSQPCHSCLSIKVLLGAEIHACLQMFAHVCALNLFVHMCMFVCTHVQVHGMGTSLRTTKHSDD
jgi:hypothetical protein